MIRYNRINNITGWFVFIVALIVYAITKEATASWWDCGEFISATYKLQVVHPPGAPIFLMIGRIFTLFASSPEKVPLTTNFFSALSCALAILFTFWIATRFASKMIIGKNEFTKVNVALVMISGIIGAFTCMFLDSLWFSAVESEVYALATFSFVIIFWAIIKWEEHADTPQGDRWIILIFLMLGLSLGVHLLSLLAIPAIGIIYYFRNYKYSAKGFWAAMGISLLALAFILFGVLDKLIAIAAAIDRFFVNDMGTPFGTGIIVYSALVIGITVYGIRYSIKNGKRLLYIALMSFSMLMVGLSSYTMVLIRANADPAINMNGINDVNSFLSYLRREQYGQRDLVYGTYWTAQPLDVQEKGDKYGRVPGQKKYIPVSKNYKIIYSLPDAQLAQAGLTQKQIELLKARNKQILFPRMGSQEDRHANYYYSFAGVPDNQQQSYVPSYWNNLSFFFDYQIGYMFWRYFMWNFSGRQNDAQGYYTDMKDGNWITGIPFIDKIKNPNQQDLPPSLKNVVSRNVFFMIPFIIGLLGMIFQIRKDWKGFIVLLVFFFFMGFMNLINSNEPPVEPRERDYALVGAFFVYAIWVGFGVLALFDIAKKASTKVVTDYLLYAGIIIAIMIITGLNQYALPSSLVILIYCGAVIGILSAIVMALNRSLKNDFALAIIIGLMCFTAPALMGAQGWNDHDRSKRTFARDFARNYLESCPPNAILFTQGDNDTYPLWYAQEVEGIRTDVRIINLSLLGVDWYINQLRHSINTTPKVNLTLTPDKILGDKRNATRFYKDSKFKDRTLDLKEVIKFIANDNAEAKNPSTGDNYIPSTHLKVSVDSAAVVNNNLVPDDMKADVVKNMTFELSNKTLLKNDLMLLDIVASNISTRPICFAITVTPDAYLGLQKYFMQTAMAYRLTPAEIDGGGYNRKMNTDIMYDLIINQSDKFKFGGIENGKRMYIDPSSLGSAMTAKYINYQQLAGELTQDALDLDEQAKQMLGRDSANTELKEVGTGLNDESAQKKQMAIKVLDMMMQKFPDASLPYDYNMINTANYYQLLGENEKALTVLKRLIEICLQDLTYYYKMYNISTFTRQQYEADRNDAERCIYNGINIARKAGDANYADTIQKQWDMLRTENRIPLKNDRPAKGK